MPAPTELKPGERLGKQFPDGSWCREDQRELRYSRMSGSPEPRETYDRRTETEADRGRIAYSGFLRRLAGVTQVTSPSLLAPRLHTRESHSHKVALVAREIAESIARQISSSEQGMVAEAIRKLGGIDITACEAAGLGHDLGHPPFGHNGEIALNRLMRADGVPDGFEGNAQTFRILTELDTQRVLPVDGARGANLTMVTLAAVLKYPRLCPPNLLVSAKDEASARPKPPKFGSYVDPGSASNTIFDRAIALMPLDEKGAPRQTVEAAIMDLADDITYAIHDFEDFYKEDRIDFSRVVADLKEALSQLVAGKKAEPDSENEFLKTAALLPKEGYGTFFTTRHYVEQIEYIVRRIETFTLTHQYSGSLRDSSRLVSITSDFVEKMFRGVTVSHEPRWAGGPSVYLLEPEWHLLQLLKTITRRYVVGSAQMATIDRSQTKVISTLYQGMSEWVREGNVSELPEPLASYMVGMPSDCPEWLKFRLIGDYIAGLSDDECFTQSRWIAGTEIPTMDSIH